MVELRCSASLAGEALHRLGVASQIFRNEFQGDVAAKLSVFRLVDHAHTPAPELA